MNSHQIVCVHFFFAFLSIKYKVFAIKCTYIRDSKQLNINLDEIIRAKLGTIFAREFVSDMSKREMK